MMTLCIHYTKSRAHTGDDGLGKCGETRGRSGWRGCGISIAHGPLARD
jgi:hypothetical protein